MAAKRKRDEGPVLFGDGDFWVQNFRRLVEELHKIDHVKAGDVATVKYIETFAVHTVKFNVYSFMLKVVPAEAHPQVCFSWKKLLAHAAGVALHEVVAESFKLQVEYMKKRATHDPMEQEMKNMKHGLKELEKKVAIMEHVEELVLETSCFSGGYEGCDCYVWTQAHAHQSSVVRVPAGVFLALQYKQGMQLWGEAFASMKSVKKEVKFWKDLLLEKEAAELEVTDEEIAGIVTLKGRWLL